MSKFWVAVEILVDAENEKEAEKLVDDFLLINPIPVEDFSIFSVEQMDE